MSNLNLPRYSPTFPSTDTPACQFNSSGSNSASTALLHPAAAADGGRAHALLWMHSAPAPAGVKEIQQDGMTESDHTRSLTVWRYLDVQLLPELWVTRKHQAQLLTQAEQGLSSRQKRPKG